MSPLSRARPPRALLALAARALPLAGALLVGACESPPAACMRDADCREGFVCDQALYKGECVQAITVVRCGERLCQYPPETCVRDRCVTAPGARVDLGEPPLGGAPAPDAAPPAGGQGLAGAAGGQAGAQGGAQAGARAGAQAGAQPADMGSSPAPDMRPPADLGPDPLARDQGGQACSSACDCPPGLACVGGACAAQREPVYCCSGAFCPPEQRCEGPDGRAGVCAAGGCETACDCQPGLACVGGSCALSASPVFCCGAGPCPAGQACETSAGRLLSCPSASCASACDCPAGQGCVNGSCAFGPTGVFCCDGAACPPGAACETAAGVRGACAGAACATACDCSPGLSCAGGQCVIGATPTFCCASSQCPADERCQNPSGVFGRCP